MTTTLSEFKFKDLLIIFLAYAKSPYKLIFSWRGSYIELEPFINIFQIQTDKKTEASGKLMYISHIQTYWANIRDPDQTAFQQSDQGLYHLPLCLNILDVSRLLKFQ